MPVVSTIKDVDINGYWDLVDRCARDILNVPDHKAGALKADIDSAPESEQLVFYNTDPLDIATQITGETPTSEQVDDYLRMIT